jgi:hypothetical protein
MMAADAWDEYALTQALIWQGASASDAEIAAACFYAQNATMANPDDDMDDLEWVVECIVSNPAMWVDCEETPDDWND